MLDLIAIARAKFWCSRREDSFVPKYRYGHESYEDVLKALSCNRSLRAGVSASR